jgi:predicted alpha/beta-fold hydrolase
VSENPCVRLVAPGHGGHCGFVSRWSGAERFWAEERIVEFVEEQAKGKRIQFIENCSQFPLTPRLDWQK